MPISRKPHPEVIPHVPVNPAIAAFVNPKEEAPRAIVKAAYAALPALPAKAGELIPGFGNIGNEDITLARIKLLQGMSPECKPDGGSHPQGKFYQTTAARTIGTELIVVPLNVRRTVELWDNRDSGAGLLARSLDGIHWDKPNSEFHIKSKAGKTLVVNTKGSVQESGLTGFGTSEPDNPRSAPLASVTYRYSLWLEDYTALGTSLLILSRTASQAAKALNDRVNARTIGGTPFYAQRFLLKAGTQKAGPNEWYVPTFENAGDIEHRSTLEELNARAAALYRANAVIAVDEEDAVKEDKYAGVDRSRNSTY